MTCCGIAVNGIVVVDVVVDVVVVVSVVVEIANRVDAVVVSLKQNQLSRPCTAFQLTEF